MLQTSSLSRINDTDFDELHEHYLEQPHEFIADVLGATPWHKQVEIVQDIFHYSRVAVKTCNSVGKSYIAARIAVTYLMLYPDSIVVTTAPTWNQVKNVLWREIRSSIKKAEQITGIQLTQGQASQVELNIDTKWYAIGVSTSTPDNMMGYHADNLLVIVDEAGGVDEAIFQGVRAITTNIHNKILLIGNPTTPDGEFMKAFGDSSNYIQHTISAFDTPNFTENNIHTIEDLLAAFTPPDGLDARERVEHFERTRRAMEPLPYDQLIDPGDVYQKYLDWGPDSDAWAALVMGEFPKQSAQSLIPSHLVTQAMQMYGTDDETGKSYAEISGWEIPNGDPHYGQDMARYGQDLNVLTPRHGGWAEKQVIWNKKGDFKQDLIESAEIILNIIDPYDGSILFSIDDTGNGGGTTDALRKFARDALSNGKQAHQYRLIDFNFAKGPSNPDKFHDITSELYWNLRDWFMKKRIGMPYDEKLKNELIGRRWQILPNKKIKVESKEEYKKRTGGKSPDRSDSLALAFADPGIGTWIDITTREVARQEEKGTPITQSSGTWSSTTADRPITSGIDRRY
jgi:phage terminase large subunit